MTHGVDTLLVKWNFIKEFCYESKLLNIVTLTIFATIFATDYAKFHPSTSTIFPDQLQVFFIGMQSLIVYPQAFFLSWFKVASYEKKNVKTVLLQYFLTKVWLGKIWSMLSKKASVGAKQFFCLQRLSFITTVSETLVLYFKKNFINDKICKRGNSNRIQMLQYLISISTLCLHTKLLLRQYTQLFSSHTPENFFHINILL